MYILGISYSIRVMTMINYEIQFEILFTSIILCKKSGRDSISSFGSACAKTWSGHDN